MGEGICSLQAMGTSFPEIPLFNHQLTAHNQQLVGLSTVVAELLNSFNLLSSLIHAIAKGLQLERG